MEVLYLDPIFPPKGLRGLVLDFGMYGDIVVSLLYDS